MKLRLPPHIAWPLFIVALLLISISASVYTLVLARASGGVEVIDGYYEKAAHWDEVTARRAASEALGWHVTVEVAPPTEAALRLVSVTIRDRDGQAVTGLHGTVRALRPQLVKPVAVIPLVEDPAVPGVYRQQIPVQRRGLWDFEVNAERDTLAFQVIIRKELL